MRVEVAVVVNAARADVWAVVTDIENAAQTISGVEKIEILERPGPGVLGLKWTETRTMFGKTAVETMWITEVSDGDYYLTEARSHGSIYRTKVELADHAEGTRLSMEFSAQTETLGARIMFGVFGGLMARSIRKALLQDLNDLKAVVEMGRSNQPTSS